MNKRIKQLYIQAINDTKHDPADDINIQIAEKFAELIVRDYAKKTIQGLMSDPAFVQAMDEYYENKWSHRFD